jgi:hypothetical protein
VIEAGVVFSIADRRSSLLGELSRRILKVFSLRRRN